MKKYNAIKIGITSILVLIVLSINSNVSATNFPVSCSGINYETFEARVKAACSERKKSIINYYDVDLDEVSSGYKVSVSSGAKAAKDDKFKIYEINGKKDNDAVGKEFENGKSVTFSATPDGGQVSVTLQLIASKGKYKQCIGRNNEYTPDDCSKKMITDSKIKDSYLRLTVRIKTEGQVVTGVAKARNDLVEKYLKQAENAVDNGGHPEEFERPKKNPDRPEDDGYTQKTISKVGNKKVVNVKDLSCNVQTKETPKIKDSQGRWVYNYSNQKQFYVREKKAAKKFKKKVVCQPTCQERIKIEYGPPVSSVSGLCVQYQVKVTSFVRCDAGFKDLTPPQPEDYDWCLPHPQNRDRSGDLEYQAGPTEEYDKCIKKCDKGKYTAKCSRNCYKKVYGNNSNTKLDNKLEYNSNSKARKMSNSCTYTGKNGYYKKENNTIVWNGKGLGSWYYEYYKKPDGSWGYSPDQSGNLGSWDYKPKDGFCWGYKGSTACSDRMKWVGCSGATYLNKEGKNSAQEAYEKDLASWGDVINNCKQSVECRNRKTEYKISINYKDKNNEKWYNFPSLSNGRDADILTSGSNTTRPTANTGAVKTDMRSTILTPNEEKIKYINSYYKNNNEKQIVEYNSFSCYNKRHPQDGKWYQTEWSFPGRWKKNKIKTTQYEMPNSNEITGWRYESSEFCTYDSASTVNDKWWQYYNLGDSCTRYKNIKDSDIESWNIQASTKNFGEYNWNIQIKCFYALRENECKKDDDGCCKVETSNGGGSNGSGGSSKSTSIAPTNASSFEVINLNDPTNKNVDYRINSSIKMRQRKTGYNWTSKANNKLNATRYKNRNYVVNPEELVKDIASEGDNIYNDDSKYLQYKFELTAEKIYNIKKILESQSGKYDLFNGKYEIKNGILVYTSKIVGNNKDGGRVTIGCNRIKNGVCHNY